MRIADIFADKEVLLKTREQAKELLLSDPALKNSENIALRAEVKELYLHLQK
jgi:hypothetical protein